MCFTELIGCTLAWSWGSWDYIDFVCEPSENITAFGEIAATIGLAHARRLYTYCKFAREGGYGCFFI